MSDDAVRQHSDGPWHIEPPNVIVSANKTHVGYWYGNNDVAKANGNLMAAAPKLLVAVRRAKKLLEPEVVKEPDRTIFWELVAAIRQAEGDADPP